MQKNKLLPKPFQSKQFRDQGDEKQDTHSELILSDGTIDMEMNGERIGKEPLTRDSFNRKNGNGDSVEDKGEHFELAPASLEHDADYYRSSSNHIEMKVKRNMNMTQPNIVNVLRGSEKQGRHRHSVLLNDEHDSYKG